jgi:acyl carrier protein
MGLVVQDDEIARVIARIIDVDDEQLTSGTRLDELISDSFLLVQLAIEVQDEFDVTFYSEDLNDVQTFGDLIDLIRLRS